MGGTGRRKEAAPSDEAIAQRRLRAVEEVLDVRRLEDPVYPHLEVRNPVHRTRYRVLFPLFPDEAPAFCTCTDFARRGLGTCKHIEAAYRWLQLPENAALPVGGPPTPPPVDLEAVWGEIDRRQEQLRGRGASTIRQLQQAGAVLYEKGGTGSGAWRAGDPPV